MTTIARITSPFDAAKRQDQDGNEFWSARDLMPIMGYNNWQNFEESISRAKAACRNSGHGIEEQFTDGSKMVSIGSGATREVNDYHLTRYAAYLVAMNGDPRKPEIAAAQTYFAIKTREAELGIIPRKLSNRELAMMVIEAEDRAEREAEARRLANQEIAELESALDYAAPEVLAFRDCLSQIDTLGLQDTAKILMPIHGMGPNQFLDQLRKDGVLYHASRNGGKVNYPVAEYVDRGFFRLVPSGYVSPWGETQLKTIITRLGFEHIIRTYATESALANLRTELFREFDSKAIEGGK